MTTRILKQMMLILALASQTANANDQSIRTTLALTTTVAKGTTDADVERAETLLVMLEAEASMHTELSVVERRQIDLALHEVIVSRSQGNNANVRLTLGKLASADLIVSVRLSKATPRQQSAIVRITEPLTGVIRGATVTQIDHVDLEDTAEKIIRYVHAVVQSPETAGLTISVAPFESQAKFRHVRPLELIIRDVLTTRLQQTREFQVLQRTDMNALLQELDLVNSGFVDPATLPQTVSSRDGLYHVHGTVSDSYDDNNRMTIVVDAKLTQTITGELILSLKKEFPRKQITDNLRTLSTRIADTIRQQRTHASAKHPGRSFDESQELFHLAIRDVQRIRRRGPSGRGYRPFTLPNYTSPLKSKSRPAVDLDSEICDHLLKKSVDRLETVLFLHPDAGRPAGRWRGERADVDAGMRRDASVGRSEKTRAPFSHHADAGRQQQAKKHGVSRQAVEFALAYCYSFHRPGVWNPERCEHLFRQIIHSNKKSALAQQAFRRLGEVYCNHQGNHEIRDEHIPLMIRTMDFIFEAAPPETGISFTTRMHWLTKLHVKSRDYAGLLHTTHLCWKRCEDPECFSREYHAVATAKMLRTLLSSSKTPDDIRYKSQQLVQQWGQHKDETFRQYAEKNLSTYLLTKEQIESNHLAFVDEVLQLRNPLEVDNARVRATASYFLDTKKPAIALKVLKTIDPQKTWPETRERTPNDALSYWRLLAKTYEAMQQREKALEAYIASAELKRGAVLNHSLYEKIEELGGVPLRPDRHIDVKYHTLPGKRRHSEVLATNGRELFCGRLEYRYLPGIFALNLESGTWRELDNVPHYVTCLEIHNGTLWAGTRGHGLWKVDLVSGDTTQISSDDGLPDDTVLSIAIADNAVYASVGETTKALTPITGGVVRIGNDGSVRYLQGGQQPPIAPTSMVVAHNRLLAVSKYEVYEWNEALNKWSEFADQKSAIRLFFENNRLWTGLAADGLRLKEVAANGREYVRDVGDLNHRPSPYFLIDRGDYLWMGGKAWNYFRGSGFYRAHKESGKVDIFGPRDGFRIGRHENFTCYDGVYAQGRIWLATSSGVAEIAIRESAGRLTEVSATSPGNTEQ